MSSAVYRALCKAGDKIVYPILPKFAQPAWNHAAGPKTVFFWAPTIKWILVGAGLADLARPAEKLSVAQNAALAATGLIWTRYCLAFFNLCGWPIIDTITRRQWLAAQLLLRPNKQLGDDQS
uniref:Mitochondrial pyruvate carrier n=1 Tax=Ditylenchus dipsaci TaxID=166011 RepID=A0A915DEL9_9BILA